MSRTKPSFCLLILAPLMWACTEKVDPDVDEQTFTRFYDDKSFNESYYPIDVTATPDGGYLILSGKSIEDSNLRGTYLIKTDAEGNVVSDHEFEDNYVNAVGNIISLNDSFYFFCMDGGTQQSKLVKTDQALANTEIINIGGSIYYPAAASADNDNLLLLSYDHVARESVISLIGSDGSLLISRGFTIGAGDEVEQPIIDHFIHTGRQFPFQVGKAAGLYFFNGFYNYTFSLVFTDLSQDTPVGVVQGQQDDGGFSAVLPIDGSFAAARFNFGANYFLPQVDLSTTTISSSTDLGGNTLPELEPDAPVSIINAAIKGASGIIYASNTRSKQIGLYVYDAQGAFLGSRYLGFSNPFELASIHKTDDDGVIVLGTTYLAGRLSRPCLFKLPKDKLGPE